MDNAVLNQGNESRGVSAAVYFAWFAIAAAIFAALGMKYSASSGILEGATFYGRYDGLEASGIGGLIIHMRAAVMCALPCLAQLLTLYILSFSSLLIPAAILTVGWRGSVMGVAYGAVSSTATAVQLITYAVITLALCFTAAMLLRFQKESVDTKSKILGKTAALTIAAGFAVICELVLSYMI